MLTTIVGYKSKKKIGKMRGLLTNKKKRQRKWWGKIYLPVLTLFFHLVCPHPPYPYPIDFSSALWGSLPFQVRTGQISPLMKTVLPDQSNYQILWMAKTLAKSHILFSRWPVQPRLPAGWLVRFPGLYYYMRNFCNLIGLEQWYFSLIWNTYMWKLQTFSG